MIEQNTDRMWYVIGSILIGSSILFGFMGIIQLIGGLLIVDDNAIANYDSYMLYYYGYDDRTIANLKRYDMVVLDPLNMDQETVIDIQSADTDVYAYQSVIGVELANRKKRELMNEEDYVWINGEKPKHSYFKYYFGDIRTEGYQQVLLELLKTDVIDAGYDGIFYDTLDDMDRMVFRENRNPETNRRIRNEMMEATVEYFERVREMYPDLTIIQNRGFDLYTMENSSAPYVNAIMFENLQYEYFQSEVHGAQYEALRNRIDKSAKATNGVVMTLSYDNPERNFQQAREFNWLYSYYDTANAQNMMHTEMKIYDSFNPNLLDRWLTGKFGIYINKLFK